MPSKLDSLIRFQKWELDNKRRELAQIEEEREQIVGQLNGLMEEFDNERANAGHDAATLMMGAYAHGVSLRREVMEEQLAEKEKELDEIRDQVTEAFQELKTYEIAEKNRKDAERKEENRQEGLMLDEQGLQGYVRGKS